jgi:hypothetical protein
MLAGFYYINDAAEVWRIHGSGDRYAIVQQVGGNAEEFEVVEMEDLLDVALYSTEFAAKTAIEKEAA